MKWFSRQLEIAGKPRLDYRWTISIVKGIDRIPGFVSLFQGNQIKVAAIYVPAFDHFRPAEYLYHESKEAEKLPGFAVALDKMEKLVNDLNSLL